MHEFSQSVISLRDLSRIVFRHKTKATIVFCCALGLSVSGAFLWPKTYRSDAKLFIRLGRSSVSLDPTATVGQTLSPNEPREREINSILEILRSRELLEHVVDQIGIEAVVSASPAFSVPTSQPAADANSTVSEPRTSRESAIQKLDKSISCGVSKNSNVINASCIAGRPELAQQILAAYVRAFKAHHMRLNRTSGSYEFFVAQAEQVKTQLADAKLQLRDAKNRVGIGSVESQASLNAQQVTNLQQNLTSTRSALVAAQAKLASIREQYPDFGEPSTLETGGGSSASAVDNMRAELYRLQIQERELLAKLSSQHPKVAAIREQAKQARRLLAQQEYQTEATNELTLKARVAELQQRLDQARTKLLRLNEDEVRIRELEQRVTSLQASYDKYVDNREQARIDGELETERISNVNVAQSPTLVSRPISPKKAVVLVVGFVLAVFATVLLTLVCEYFDDSFQTPEQVERILDLPVVLAVPDSRRHVVAWR